MSGEVEADETFIGGLAKNMHEKKRKHIGTGAARSAKRSSQVRMSTRTRFAPISASLMLIPTKPLITPSLLLMATFTRTTSKISGAC
jgi:hypothetical protein